ncbi:helix-turn-helix domain-containing protein [Ekhidna sp.]|uniref:helix-turn-helix domain-containing protein n=1 Tax=Ekhidna sp. TaxID=2608089 RepID=UPI003299B378
MKEYKHPGNEKNFYKGFTYTFKKEVVEQVLNGLMSQRYAAEKYGISRNTVASWCKQFNPDMGSKNHPKDKEIKKLKEKVEELEMLKDIQQYMLAELQKQVGREELEKFLPKQLFKEIQKKVHKNSK